MELAIQSGKTHRTSGVARFLMLAAAMAIGAFAQTTVPTCTTAGVAANVHPEGLTELLGAVSLYCTGGTAGATANVTAFVGLQNATITNSPNSNGSLGISVSISNGAGSYQASASALVNGTQTMVVQGILYTIPTGGITTQITITGIRAAIGSTPNLQVVYANVGGVGINVSSVAPVPLGVPGATGSVLTSYLSGGVPCNGSPLPSLIDFPDFLAAGTASSSLRVTEGYSDAFTNLDQNLANGTRIVVSLAGYPTGARVFVPDTLVGSSGTGPTSTGAFGTFAQVGFYSPGSGTGQLLLTRVDQADQYGAGGNPVLYAAPSAPSSFPNMTEVILKNGAATVTYQIIESAPSIRESVQIPVFVTAGPTACTTVVQPTMSAKIGPISTVAIADSTQPFPRFVSATAASDCSVIGDCSASYFPTLNVSTTAITLNGSAYGSPQLQAFQVSNSGQGLISYTISVAYPAGAATGWLTVTPASGYNTTGVNVSANPGTLQPGAYSATITVNAGQYGLQTIAVTFNVGSPGVTIQSIVNAATFLQGGPLTAGSIASLYGLNLNGKVVTVSFSGVPATVFGIYQLSGNNGLQQQINLLVPASLAGQTSANAVVNVDGVLSNTFPVSLVQNSPGVFNPGILNQNYSVNTAAAPAKVGTIISAYMTGLTIPLTGQVTIKIGSTDFLVPQYAGVAPTLTGVQQINVLIPTALPFTGNQAGFQVCIPSLDPTQRLCSPAVPLYLTQ